ncbi:MAG: ATP-binding protein [Nitrospiraceae bacterium]|nr:ATP-binding protein [Nitrospiraceae bacterium]
MKKFIRYLTKQVKEDLTRKMVFIGGPRQVGKTTLAKSLLPDNAGYLNWDAPEHREKILGNALPGTGFLVFDEIHKYRQWRNFLKGLYDTRAQGLKILVTGSARLDIYRYGGDSLQGRYHYLRLHPLSTAELKILSRKDFNELFRLGGFPEPFFSSSEIQAKRWSREYRTRLIREDVLSVERIQDVGQLELLVMRLPELVGSPLSLNALREDLQIAHKTVSRWLDSLERMYAIFRLLPFGAPGIRAVKKERKHYHFDWTLVKDPAARFENMVAVHLLKWVHFEEDTKGRDLELRYFRDVDGREVDFVVLECGKPIELIECKWSDKEISGPLKYMKFRFKNAHARQIYAEGMKDYVSKDGIAVMPAWKYLAQLV